MWVRDWGIDHLQAQGGADLDMANRHCSDLSRGAQKFPWIAAGGRRRTGGISGATWRLSRVPNNSSEQCASPLVIWPLKDVGCKTQRGLAWATSESGTSSGLLSSQHRNHRPFPRLCIELKISDEWKNFPHLFLSVRVCIVGGW